MELQVTNLSGKSQGSVTLQDEIFGLEPRTDLLHRMVRYQQLKAMAGTHQVKHRSDGARTGKKFVKQKGSGGARHGDRKAPQFRGGGRAFGPRRAAMRSTCPRRSVLWRCVTRCRQRPRPARSSIVDNVATEAAKTAALRAQFGKLEWANALIIDGAELNQNFALAARNIPNIDVLPIQGINVADILRRHKLVLTRAALEAIEARFAKPEGASA